MNKPITEKDFQRIADFYGIGPAEIYHKLYPAMFNEAKRMAIDFATWFEKNHYRMVDREEDKHKGQWYKYYTVRKDFPAGFAMSTTVTDYFTTEQLFELYQQQKNGA